jgi:quinol monooxygenase YgiN
VIRISAEIVVSECEAHQLVDALRALMISTRLERGCLGCTVRTTRDEMLTVHYEEQWETEGDVRRRVDSDGFTWILALLERADAPPRVQFDFVTMTRGLDYVAEVRTANAREA